MAVVVYWPGERMEEFGAIKLTVGRELTIMQTIILDSAELFIGANSCTIRTKDSIKIYPYAVVQEIELFDGAFVKASEPSAKLELII